MEGILRWENGAAILGSDYVYDESSRLTELTHSSPAGTLAHYEWSFDAANRIVNAESPDGNSAYAHDARGQLTGADHSFQNDETYAYDANGNRTNSGYATGALNRIMSDGVYSYTYDAEGNRQTRTHLASGAITAYAWDHENRLTTITEYPNALDPATQIVRYMYDLNGRRIAKHVDSDADGVADDSTHYVYDGFRQERDGAGDAAVLTFDEAGNLTHRYLSGPAVDQILADEQLTTTAPQ